MGDQNKKSNRGRNMHAEWENSGFVRVEDELTGKLVGSLCTKCKIHFQRTDSEFMINHR